MATPRRRKAPPLRSPEDCLPTTQPPKYRLPGDSRTRQDFPITFGAHRAVLVVTTHPATNRITLAMRTVK